MTELVTTNRGYQKPRPGQKLKDDVLRLIAALDAIDIDVAALLLALADKSNVGHGHSMDAIAGLAAALSNKLDVGHHDALGDLTDVDIAGAANGMTLLRQAAKWIPVALQINNITGLEAALNGKATPADIAAAINTLVGAAPGTLDTLNELADALGDDPNFAATMTAALGGKLAKAQNLADLPDKAVARTNLEVPSSTAFQTLLDGVLRKDQDQSSQALSAGFKVNILKNALQSWEQWGQVQALASATQALWTNIPDFWAARLRVLVSANITTGIALSYSLDGGSSWRNGAADYVRIGKYKGYGVTSTETSDTGPYLYMNVAENQQINEIGCYTWSMAQGSGSRMQSRTVSEFYGSVNNGFIQADISHATQFNGPISGIRLNGGGTGALLSGRAVLEIIRR